VTVVWGRVPGLSISFDEIEIMCVLDNYSSGSNTDIQNCAVPPHSGSDDDDDDDMNDVLQHCMKKLHTPESNKLKRVKLWQSIQN